GPVTVVTYDWRVRAEKGILRDYSLVMKPLFRANHHWAMARGLESLRLEIARRRASGDPAILAAIPAPPGPTRPHHLRRRRRSPRRGRGGGRGPARPPRGSAARSRHLRCGERDARATCPGTREEGSRGWTVAAEPWAPGQHERYRNAVDDAWQAFEAAYNQT